MMSQPLEQHSADHAKGVEVFVGGLPRTIDEEKIREVFSDCGDIVEVRMIKDQNGNTKGFCFVRFSTKESAARAVREKTGILLDGKKIGVLPSSEQETLYFGNLNKAWTADEFKRMVLQIFPDIESIDLAMIKDTPPGQKPRNRGFAFVKFSSHAAAARALRVGSQPEFRLGSLHPAIQWAEEDSEIDAKELAKVKVAFVRNLPTDAEEKYLSRLFDPYGKVERVVVSKKGSSSVGFVHFTERSDLERAVNELNGKKVGGPREGQEYVVQVEVARPMEKSKKRVREYPENTSSFQDQSKILKSNIQNSHISREVEPADPYEDAVIALPLAVKERLLRILRLGIATRFDIDVNSLRSLKELPEPIAISVLDQFMISGSASQNKSAYLAAVISKHLVDKVGPDQSLVSLLRAEDTTRTEYKPFNFSNQLSSPIVGSFTSHADTAARSDIYAPHHSALRPDYPLSNRTMIGRVDERGSLLSSRSLYSSESIPIPRTVLEEGSRSLYASESIPIPRTVLEEGSNSRFEATPPHPTGSYGRVAIQTEERHLSPPQVAPSSSYARLGPGLISDVRGVARQQASRPQMRFDPFTGEPYKFDPFTGEPIIHPANPTRHF
ncbi:uncharacterized protein LOC130989623 [Salvia miltiorrhiza]|uniref:uncharacterized protein LOC130989623 n=1 Tax=Salvia miltiorrhiza TaxID=226208 RepID=UPI0025ABD880|nr:uncharacterized protein LOC130989623 [Salvia miltiorrhiza]